MSFWKLEDSRLVQIRSAVSAANDLVLAVGGPGVPQGKIWVITGFGYRPSVAETQVVSFEKYNTPLNMFFAINNPVSMNLNPAWASFIEQGMEYMLFPGEYIICRRVAATAASTISANMQFIEIDQPLYTYEEPQIVHKQKRALSTIRSMMGGGSGGGSGPGSGPGSIGGGRSGPLPV